MSKTIEAIFENGVFKPLQKVDIKEHEQVEIRVIPKGEWGKGFNRLIRKIHKKSAQYPSEEIEADISQAIKEVREEIAAVLSRPRIKNKYGVTETDR